MPCTLQSVLWFCRVAKNCWKELSVVFLEIFILLGLICQLSWNFYSCVKKKRVYKISIWKELTLKHILQDSLHFFFSFSGNTYLTLLMNSSELHFQADLRKRWTFFIAHYSVFHNSSHIYISFTFLKFLLFILILVPITLINNFFQATFKGWMDIMYAAVDSREVCHVFFPFLLSFSIHTIHFSAIFAVKSQKYKWMNASNYVVRR